MAKRALEWPKDLSLFNLALNPEELGNEHVSITLTGWSPENLKRLREFLECMQPGRLVDVAPRQEIHAPSDPSGVPPTKASATL